MAILVGLNAIVCVGLNLLIGYAGQISLGHAGFFGLGAYGSALLTSRYGWPPLAALAAAIAGVALLAFVVGRPILRLQGTLPRDGDARPRHHRLDRDRHRGRVDRRARRHGGAAADAVRIRRSQGERMWYWVVGGCLLVAVWLALNLIESPTGRALRALHTSEIAAEVVGIDSARHKVMVFVVSAVFAAIAGGLAAYYSGFITPAKASFLHSIELVTMVVFGGMASTFGAVVGAAVLTVLPQALTVLKDYEMVVFGALMMLTMIFLPRGVVPTPAAPGCAGGRGEHACASSDLSKEFGGVHAVEDLSFDVPARGGPLDHRPERRRQDNAAQSADRRLRAQRAAASCSTSATSPARRRTNSPRPASARTFQNLQIFFNMSALENVMTGRHLRERCGLLAALLHTPRLARAERECRERALELLRFLGLERLCGGRAPTRCRTAR